MVPEIRFQILLELPSLPGLMECTQSLESSWGMLIELCDSQGKVLLCLIDTRLQDPQDNCMEANLELQSCAVHWSGGDVGKTTHIIHAPDGMRACRCSFPTGTDGGGEVPFSWSKMKHVQYHWVTDDILLDHGPNPVSWRLISCQMIPFPLFFLLFNFIRNNCVYLWEKIAVLIYAYIVKWVSKTHFLLPHQFSNFL